MYLFGGSDLEKENKEFYALDLKTYEWRIVRSVVSYSLLILREINLVLGMSTQPSLMAIRCTFLEGLLQAIRLMTSGGTHLEIISGRWSICLREQRPHNHEQAIQLFFIETRCIFLGEKTLRIINLMIFGATISQLLLGVRSRLTHHRL